MLDVSKFVRKENEPIEEERENVERLRRINNLRQEISDLRNKLNAYTNFRSSLEALANDLDEVKEKINSSSTALSEALIIDNFGVGEEGMGQIVTCASRYSRSLRYNFSTIDAKIQAFEKEISNKQNALNGLL